MKVKKVVAKKTIPYEVLLNELISVNGKDQFAGSIDKWQAHSNSYLASPNSLPHRAFSIFLFNNENKLLMQKRSVEKRTFPLCWTNTCCSHPNMVKLEKGDIQQEPIRASLGRALHRELRMNLDHSPFYFMNKILYKQLGFNGKDDFGEFEVDYVYLNKLATKTIAFEIVPSEIHEVKWIGKEQLKPFMEQTIKEGGYFSPWFSKMSTSGHLYKWWEMVEQNRLADSEGESANKVINLE